MTNDVVEALKSAGLSGVNVSDAALTSAVYGVWLVRYELDGVWHTFKTDSGRDIKCGGRKGFRNACKRAMVEGRAMKWAHMTAVVRLGDEDAPIIHRTAENNFTL